MIKFHLLNKHIQKESLLFFFDTSSLRNPNIRMSLIRILRLSLLALRVVETKLYIWYDISMNASLILLPLDTYLF